MAIFKGKRKLKFVPSKDVKVKIQVKGWMDSILMVQWFKSVILPYTNGKCTFLVIDSFSAHEDINFLNLAHSHCVDVVIIPGGCMSKIQPLDVSLKKPFKSIVRQNGWSTSIRLWTLQQIHHLKVNLSLPINLNLSSESKAV